MTHSRSDLDARLDRALEEIRTDVPDDAACQAAADRALSRLASAPAARSGGAGPETIRGCDDVRRLLDAHVAGTLPAAKAELVQDHTRECVPCRRALMAAREGHAERPVAAAWSPADAGARRRTPRAGAWWTAAAAAMVVGVALAILAAAGLLPGPWGAGEAVAEIASIDGALFLVGDDARPLAAGDSIAERAAVRTARGSGAVLALADGSRVEMRERSELSLDLRGGDTTVDLERGSVIVEAAKRSRGHLFVDTEDCRVAVTGTIFSVNHGTKGSRVSVIEGTVRVEQGRQQDLIHPGEQVTTRAYLDPVPVAREIAWSQSAPRYLELLAELQALHQELRQAVTVPAARTSTRLVDLVPAGTVFYAAVPNLAESLHEARRVVRERIAASPVLQEALEGDGSHQEELDRMIGRLRDFGSFLGDEVVFALRADAIGDHPEPDAVAIAEVRDPAGFASFLAAESAARDEGDPEIVVVSSPEEATAGSDDRLYVWLTDGLAVASPGAEGLRGVAAAMAGSGGIAGTPFYAQIAGAYADGVEWLFAADLESLMARIADDEEGSDLFGLEGARYLLVQWSESGERPRGNAVLAFDGPRRGVASWLAAPAPMGSLEFVTADAAAAAAFIVREPAEMVDELLAMLVARDPDALAELERVQREQGFDLRADLAAPLGGEMAVALDGPLAPVPSYKVVVEVYDPAAFQATLEWAIARIDAELRARGEAGGFAIIEESMGGATVYRVATPAEGVAVYYTYADGYLVATPGRALLERALSAHATGANLLAAEGFRQLLPADAYTNFSAVAYQDVGAHLAPLAERMARMGEGAAVERGAALAMAPASLAYAYGEEDRIVFAASVGGDGFVPLLGLLGGGGGQLTALETLAEAAGPAAEGAGAR